MNDDVVIRVENVKKHFKVYPDKGKTLKDKVLFRHRNRYELREVLKGISFEVKRGEAIGLIGKNGCGKSTTLKMLTKILRPNEGTIEIKGRVSSLIELGAGFHPDLTGRENIYINASIFGIKAKEVDERLDDIIRFSELEEYIDNPVRTYSSGMYMRLAFAVAINVDADVLLIDEILAVGDVSFQTKCFEKLKEIKAKGTTIVIVSHAMSQIEQICDRCIWIEEGLILEEGKAREIGERYLASMEEKRLEKKEKEFQEKLENSKGLDEIKSGEVCVEEEVKRESETEDVPKEKLPAFCDSMAVRMGKRDVEIVDFAILNSEGENVLVLHTGEQIEAVIKYRVNVDKVKVDCRFGISRDDGVHCYGSSSYGDEGDYKELSGMGEIHFIIHDLNLLPGKYFIDIGLRDEEQIACDIIKKVREMQITLSNTKESGIVSMKHKWL
ncbi:MAG: ABC transporter ATP-binding protein [Lachnospiraceae bacterium]|nr:ABC transporter ATP-binding protein [Lachnospiraceae bacterium]